MPVKIVVRGNRFEVSRSDPDNYERGDTDAEITDISAYYIEDENLVTGYRGMGETVFPDLYEDFSAGDSFWGVIAIYDAYDTFGRDGGQSQVMEVFENEQDADRFVQALEDTRDYSIDHEGRHYYIPWTGWGAQLTEIYTVPLVAQRERKVRSRFR